MFFGRCCVEPGGSGEASLSSRPFLQSVLDALDCYDNDYTALFALCLLYALGHNTGECTAPSATPMTKQSIILSVELVFGIIIYHDFLPTPRRGNHVKSGKTHTQ